MNLQAGFDSLFRELSVLALAYSPLADPSHREIQLQY